MTHAMCGITQAHNAHEFTSGTDSQLLWTKQCPGVPHGHEVTSVEPDCTCGGLAACQQCQDRDATPTVPDETEAVRCSCTDGNVLADQDPDRDSYCPIHGDETEAVEAQREHYQWIRANLPLDNLGHITSCSAFGDDCNCATLGPRLAQRDAALVAAACAERAETIKTLRDAYRAAIGVPESQHQRERMERLASDLEGALGAVAAARTEGAREVVERIEALIGPDVVFPDWENLPHVRRATEKCNGFTVTKTMVEVQALRAALTPSDEERSDG